VADIDAFERLPDIGAVERREDDIGATERAKKQFVADLHCIR
jgi:hypothetical protein